MIIRALPGEDFSDLAGGGHEIVGGWVFGQEIVEEGGFGGFGRFDGFGFGFAQMWWTRFARAGWELEIERHWDRKEAAERAENLGRELRSLRGAGDGFGVMDEMDDMAARAVDQEMRQEFQQPLFAAGEFDCGVGCGGGVGLRGAAWGGGGGWRGGRGRAGEQAVQPVAQTIKAGAEQSQHSAFNTDLMADAKNEAFQLDQDGVEVGDRCGDCGRF